METVLSNKKGDGRTGPGTCREEREITARNSQNGGGGKLCY